MSNSISVRHLSAGFSDRVILRDVSLEAKRGEIVGILGPAGVGKSTFLRTLSGWNDLLPSFWSKGQALLDGENLLDTSARDSLHRKVPLLAQKKRLYTASVLDNLLADLPADEAVHQRSEQLAKAKKLLQEFDLWTEMEPLLDEAVVSLPIGTQRCIAIARMVAGGAHFLLADEPLRDISEPEVEQVKNLLKKARSHCGVVLVTHNLAIARSICDRAALLVAGKIVESGPASEFFQRPEADLTRQFLATGNCWPSEVQMSSPEWRDPVVEPPQAQPEQPRSLKWILKGRLGGMRMPGLLGPLDADLASLQRLGCRALISLRSEERVEQSTLSAYGIEGLHFPIVDMGTPSPELALEICRTIERFLQRDRPTVIHCKAGLGRTGTMLACFLVYRKSTAVAAVESVRAVNPHYIQNQEQVEFVGVFERFLEGYGLSADGIA